MPRISGTPPLHGKPSSLFGRLENLGVGSDTGADEAKRTRLANRLALSYLLIAWPYFFIFRWCGMPALAWIVPPVLAWHVLTLALNARGRTRSARVNLALNASLSITAVAIALGRGSGAHNLLLTAMLNALILFDWRKERPFVLAGLTVNAALYLGYQSLGFRVGALYAPPPGTERLLRITFSLANLFGILAGLFHLAATGARAGKALLSARDKAEAADRLKSRFIANLSHEIRTPLNVILGLAKVLETPAGEAESRRREFLSDIQSSAAGLMDTLNAILDLSRLEAGTLRLEPRPFRAAELAEAALSPFRQKAARKGLALVLDAEVDGVGPLLGDSSRLEQVLRHILSNAVEFTSRGTVALRLRSGRISAGRRELQFEVIDTGPGIPPEAQDGLFQPFRQADDSIMRPHGGTGVGLAICKGLADLMGAALTLESRPGLGTTVRFSAFFPPSEADAGETGRTPPRSDAVRGEMPGMPDGARILIVEDHDLNRMVLRNMLAAQGFRADEARQGEEALDACAAGPYDLILMDYHMPVMDGIECTKRIRARWGRSPIIVGVTADALPVTRDNCLAAGMDRIILKPVDLDELRRVLAPWRASGKTAVPRPVPAGDGSAWVDAARLDSVVKATRLREPAHRRRAWRQFQADADALRRALTDARGAGNAKEMKDSAHGLKGLCLTMGLNRLAETCRRIESVSMEAAPDWSPVLAEFEAVYGPSLEELGRLLDGGRETAPAGADGSLGSFSPPAA